MCPVGHIWHKSFVIWLLPSIIMQYFPASSSRTDLNSKYNRSMLALSSCSHSSEEVETWNAFLFESPFEISHDLVPLSYLPWDCFWFHSGQESHLHLCVLPPLHSCPSSLPCIVITCFHTYLLHMTASSKQQVMCLTLPCALPTVPSLVPHLMLAKLRREWHFPAPSPTSNVLVKQNGRKTALESREKKSLLSLAL